MHFIHTALTTLAFASVAFAIVVPATLGDGHWRAQRNTTGHIVWTKIGDVPARRNAPAPIGGGAARFLPARGITNPDAPSVDKRDETGCTGNSLNSIWTTDARNDIYSACSQGVQVPAYSADGVIYGNVVWYACNYNSFQRSCQGSDVTVTEDSVNWSCGIFWSGWDHIDSINFTYGRDFVNNDVCSNL